MKKHADKKPDAKDETKEDEQLGAPAASVGDPALAAADSAPDRAVSESDGTEGAEVQKSESPEPVGTAVKILMRSTVPFDKGQLEAGKEIGSVTLASGISLNYFIEAIRNGLASEESVVKELRGDK